MKYFLIYLLCCVIFFCGCSEPIRPASYYNYQLSQIELKEKQLQLISFKRIDGEIKGPYYLTFSPIFFSETEDVRKARHKFIEQNVALELRMHKYGLKPLFDESEHSSAKYVIQYSYDTSPGINRTFSHSFRLTIFETGIIGLPKKEVWEGSVSIKKAYSSDISLYFENIIMKLFEGFPEPQHTMKDFLDNLER